MPNADLYQKHNAQQIARGKILAQKALITSGQHVLDIGCGTGELTAHISELVGSTGAVLGIDPDMSRLLLARKNVTGVVFEENTIEKFIPPEEKFDVIFSNYAYHWVQDKTKGLRNIRESLKVGGILAMNFISAISPISRDLKAICPDFDHTFAETNPVIGIHDWLSLLETNHFRLIDTYPVENYTYDSLTDFLAFWEAATNGNFTRDMLDEAAYQSLLFKYPGKLAFYGKETLSFTAERLA